MPWGINAVSAAYSRLLGVLGVGTAHPGLPKISLGEGFYSQSIIVARSIDNVADSFRDFREPLTTSLHEVILPSIRENFSSEGRPSWQRLAESTVRRRGDSEHPILVRTGKLRNAATSADTWRVTNDTVTPEGIDDIVSYAKYQQAGTKTIPPRPFLMLQDQDLDAIETIFGRWVDDRIRFKGGFT